MFSEKLIVLLEGFTKYELNQLRKFLLSPYFNEQNEVVQLFDLCNAALRKGPDAVARLDKAAVWRRLYPGQPNDDAQLRRLASDLTQLTLKFMALEYREGFPPDEWLDLQEVLEKPGLGKHLAGVERQIVKFWEQYPEKSARFYLSNFRLYWNQASKSEATVDFMEKLRPADHHLESFYIVQKLKLYVDWLQYRGVRSTSYDLTVMPGFWQHLQDERFQDIPLVIIYQNIILCLNDPNEENHFKVLMESLDHNASQLSQDDLRECYQIAQNYCALKLNQGKTEYYREVFEIFRKIIAKDILLTGNQLAEGMYKNIITASLGAGEFAWTEAFIQQYSGYLPANIRENARTFNLASLFFYQKKHQQVIELLRNVEYSDVVYTLGAKLLLLRTYYESGEFLALDSLIDSFRIFLRRNKVISKEVKRRYINFLNFLKKLVTLTANSPPAALAAFKKRVNDDQYATTKKWLLEKIDELQTR